MYISLCNKCLAGSFLYINWKLSERVVKEKSYEVIVKLADGAEKLLTEPSFFPLNDIKEDILIEEIYLKSVLPSVKPAKIVIFSTLSIKEQTTNFPDEFSWLMRYKKRNQIYHIIFYQQDNIIKRGLALGRSHDFISCRSVFEFHPSNYSSDFKFISFYDIEAFPIDKKFCHIL